VKFQLKTPDRFFIIIAFQSCPFLGVREKAPFYLCVPLNANELLLPAPVRTTGDPLHELEYGNYIFAEFLRQNVNNTE